MKTWIKPILSMAVIALSLSACGERAPAAWNANLDVDCKPHDPYDKAYAKIAPEKFWREQEYDLGTMMKAGKKNLEMSQSILDDSHAQEGDYFTRANELADKKGLSGSAKRDHVKENMDRYNKEVKDIETRLKAQEIATDWVRKCQQVVDQELQKLNLMPIQYDPEKRPM